MSITVKELREKLAGYPDDMLVAVYANHGQCLINASTITMQKVPSWEAEEYMKDNLIHPEDVDPDEEYVDFLEIGA